MNDNEMIPTTVQVDPKTDQRVLKMLAESNQLLDYANAMVIATDGDYTTAVNDMVTIKNLKKALETRRVEYVKPLNDFVKGIQVDFKVITEPINQADIVLGGKMLGFQDKVRAQRQAEEEVNRLRMEAAQLEMKTKGEVTEPLDLVPVTAAAPKTVQAEAGSVGSRMVKTWELEDMSLVPIDYMILDTVKINKVVKAGIPSIPGIRIFEKTVLTVRPGGTE